MNSSVRCILQGTKSPGTASQAAIQNHFSAQFSVCEAVNYLHLLCLFKYLDSMNGLTAGFENKEALHKAAAGMHSSALQAAPPPACLIPAAPHHQMEHIYSLSFITLHASLQVLQDQNDAGWEPFFSHQLSGWSKVCVSLCHCNNCICTLLPSIIHIINICVVNVRCTDCHGLGIKWMCSTLLFWIKIYVSFSSNISNCIWLYFLSRHPGFLTYLLLLFFCIVFFLFCFYALENPSCNPFLPQLLAAGTQKRKVSWAPALCCRQSRTEQKGERVRAEEQRKWECTAFWDLLKGDIIIIIIIFYYYYYY